MESGSPGEALLIPFDRILVGKTDIRSFTIENTSDLPVNWIIDPEDFLDSTNIAISPDSGVLKAGQSATITISFFSQDPLVVDGKFLLKYVDISCSTPRLFPGLI